MFSFFGGGSGSGSNSGKPNSQSTTPVRETSASLNPPSYDPSQMNQQPQPSPASTAEETVSSFSFISGGGSQSGGLFGGMSVADDSSNISDVPADSQISSGFSFLNAGSSFGVSEPTQEPVPESSGPSGFSFMMGGSGAGFGASESDIPPPVVGPPPMVEPDLLSMPDVVPQQDVKLSKVAATKVVKKKKKVARVGVGRDDEDTAAPGRRASIEPDDEAHEEALAQTHTSGIDEESNHYTVEEVPPEISTPPPPPSHLPVAPPTPEPPTFVVREPSPEPYPAVPPQTEVPLAAPSSATASDFLMSLGTTSFSDNSMFDVPITTHYPQEESETPQPVAPSSAVSQPIVVSAPSEAVVEEPDDNVIPKNLLRGVQQIDDTIRDSMIKIRSAYQTAYASQHYVLRQIEDCHNQITSCKEKLALLEMKQANYAKQEEFELAEQMTSEIDQTERELQNKVHMKEKLIEKLHKHRMDYDQEKSKLITYFHQSFDGLTKVCEKTSNDVAVAKVKVEEYVEEERGRIEVEQQRIDLEKSHCDREQQTLDSESAVIEEAIKSQVGDFYSKKETIEVQLFAVQDEIRKLEELLAVKKQEEHELSKNLKQVDTKIGEVRKKYDRQLSRIQERKDTLSRAQRECVMEQEQVDKSKASLETTLSEASHLVEEANEMIRWKQTESQASEWIVQDLLVTPAAIATTSDETMSSLSLDFAWYGTVSDSILGDISQESNGDARVSTLRQEVESKELELSQVKASVDEIHVEHELLETRQKKVLETIERCEIAKKLHAANKRFKEAANSAKELKEAADAKEKLEQEIASSQETINVAVKRMEEVESELSVLKEALKESQREEKLIHLNVISRRVATCQYMVKRLSKTIDKLLTNSGGHSRVGLITVALDLYRDEIDQLHKLQVSLSLACNITNLEEYARQFEIPEPEELVQDEPSSELPADCDVINEETNVEVSSAGGFAFMTSDVAASDMLEDLPNASPAPYVEEAQPTADDEPVITEEAPTTEMEEPALPKVSAEELQRQIAEMEELVDQAAGEEDFDKAASIQEQIEILRAQLEAL